MPNRKEFVADGLTEEEVCKVLSADGLVYQDLDDLLDVGYSLNPSIKQFDAACFDGHYVTGALCWGSSCCLPTSGLVLATSSYTDIHTVSFAFCQFSL